MQALWWKAHLARWTVTRDTDLVYIVKGKCTIGTEKLTISSVEQHVSPGR